MRYAIIILALCFSMPFAQEAVLAALDSIEENTLGFSLNGRAKSGILSSTLSSDALEDDVSEHLAFTDFLLSISVRPSNETKATFDLRFHKDWQSAYREGNNIPIIRWWSYDGNILDKKLKFNLGTMRIAYTPLTIYLPEPNLIMEPEIFASLKKEAMEERYLDGTNRRLLQGLNAEFSTSAGFFDKIFAQGTIARLRKTPNSTDRQYFDFDVNKERFSTAARLGVETYGVSLGISDVYTFNRFGSSVKTYVEDYEKNNVLSFDFGYNSKKQFSGSLNFGAGVEYALSNWKQYKYNESKVKDSTLRIRDDIALPSHTSSGGYTIGGVNGGNGYLYYEFTEASRYELSKVQSLNNKTALLANAFVAIDGGAFEAKLSGHFLNVNKDFESELAASPAYLPNLPILNSDATINSVFEQFRTGSLENMYYSLYYSLPLTARTMISMEGKKPQDVIGGYNNYKFSQYYRNSYTQQTYTRLERETISNRLDPSVNMALPYGYATPDRTGGDADLNFVWNKAVSVSGVFGMYSSEFADYTRFGGGLEVNIAGLAGLGRALVISGSYEQNKEDADSWNSQVNRIMAGLKVGVWRGISLIGGFQQLNKEFEASLLGVDKISEMLVLGGPQVKISERASASLQGGLLSHSIEGGGKKLELDKIIASGIVTVAF